jgi:hypothetical protein
MREVAQRLALECVLWALVVAIAELFTRILHDRIFANTHWITRSRPDAGDLLLNKSRESHAVGVSATVSRTLKTEKVTGWLVYPLSLIASAAIAMVMLAMLMNSAAKGQVFMACFVAFLVSTICSYLAFPQTRLVALLLAVPLTAGVGYLYGGGMISSYPGHAGFFAMRALPIDYLAAGAPGAVLGYYWAMQWSLHSSLEEE